MKFDIDAILSDMIGAAKGVVGTEWKKVKATAEQFLHDKKKRLRMLAESRLAKDINDEELLSFLEDEKKMLGSELAALKIITKSVAQKAANAAIDVLWQAIEKLLPGGVAAKNK